MTDKQIVEDFLHFLNTHKGYIVTDTGADQTYNYLELRRAIINCLNQAMEDGFRASQIKLNAEDLYEVSISGKKDW